MKIGVVIVEDAQRDIDYLSSYLESNNIVDWIRSARDVASAVALIDTHEPNLVFLDVNLPDGTGFDVLEHCSFKDFSIIFSTSYEEYALKAIKFSAVDYLLKPYPYQEVSQALEKVKRLTEPNSKVLYKNLFGLSVHEKRIGINSTKDIKYLKLGDIVRCEANGNYTTFILTEGERQLSSKPIKEYEELLEEFHFLRVHKSHLINLNHVKSFVKNDGGFIIMSDELEIPISKNKKEDFLQRMKAIK